MKSKWLLSQEFLQTQLDKVKFEKDLISFMEKNKFDEEDAEHFCLILKEALSFFTLKAKIIFSSNKRVINEK